MLSLRLPDADEIDALPPEQVPAAVAALAAVQTRLALRLITHPAPMPVGMPDEYLGIDAAARLVHRSRSWMEKHGRKVPGYRQPRGRKTRAEWNRCALEAWGRLP